MTQPGYLQRGKVFYYPNFVNIVDGTETSDWPADALLDVTSLQQLSVQLDILATSGVVGAGFELVGTNWDDTAAMFVPLYPYGITGTNTGSQYISDNAYTVSGSPKPTSTRLFVYKDLPRYVKFVQTNVSFNDGATGTIRLHLYGWTI